MVFASLVVHGLFIVTYAFMERVPNVEKDKKLETSRRLACTMMQAYSFLDLHTLPVPVGRFLYDMT